MKNSKAQSKAVRRYQRLQLLAGTSGMASLLVLIGFNLTKG